jgi:hypothetical protein
MRHVNIAASTDVATRHKSSKVLTSTRVWSGPHAIPQTLPCHTEEANQIAVHNVSQQPLPTQDNKTLAQ